MWAVLTCSSDRLIAETLTVSTVQCPPHSPRQPSGASPLRLQLFTACPCLLLFYHNTALCEMSDPSPLCTICGQPFLLPLPVPHPTLSLSLRAILPTDAPSIAHHANDERVTRHLPPHFPRPYTVQDADTFITTTYTRYAADFPQHVPPPTAALSQPLPNLLHSVHHQSLALLAIAHDGALIGTMMLFPQSSPADPLVLGYWLGAEYHRRGVMTAVLKALIAWKEAERDTEAAMQSGAGRPVPSAWRVLVADGNEANLATVRRLGFVLITEELETRSAVRILTLDRPWRWRADTGS